MKFLRAAAETYDWSAKDRVRGGFLSEGFKRARVTGLEDVDFLQVIGSKYGFGRVECPPTRGDIRVIE